MKLGRRAWGTAVACLAGAALVVGGSPAAEAKVERVRVSTTLGTPSEVVPYGSAKLLLLDPWDGLILRINRDGSPDLSFADEGRLETRYADVAVDRQGRILLARSAISSLNPSDSDAAVSRLLPDGSVDRSFGEDGIARVDMGGSYDGGSAVAVARDGRVIVGGTRQTQPENRGLSDSSPAVARLLPDGAVDRSFGNQGVRLLRRGWEGGVWNIFPIDGGGFLADGEGYLGLAIWKLTESGSMARGYNPDGVVDELGRGPRGAYSYEEELSWVERIAATPKGGAYVAATGEPESGTSDYRQALLRLKPNGKVDRSFAKNGWATASFGSSTFAGAVVALPRGVALVAGSVDRGRRESDLALSAFGPRGTPVRGFGRRGKLRIDLSRRDTTLDATVQAKSAVVLAEGAEREIWVIRVPRIG